MLYSIILSKFYLSKNIIKCCPFGKKKCITEMGTNDNYFNLLQVKETSFADK